MFKTLETFIPQCLLGISTCSWSRSVAYSLRLFWNPWFPKFSQTPKLSGAPVDPAFHGDPTDAGAPFSPGTPEDSEPLTKPPATGSPGSHLAPLSPGLEPFGPLDSLEPLRPWGHRIA